VIWPRKLVILISPERKRRNSNDIDHGELDKNAAKWLRQQPINGSSNVAAKTGNISIELWQIGSKFRRHVRDLSPRRARKKLSRGDFDNDQQPKNSNIDVLCANLVIWAVRRCRNHLETLLSSSSWLKIPNSPLEFRRYHNYRDISISGFGDHFRLLPLVGRYWNRFGHSLRARVVEIFRFAVGILMISVILSEI